MVFWLLGCIQTYSDGASTIHLISAAFTSIFFERINFFQAPTPPPRTGPSASAAVNNLPEIPIAYNDKVVAFLRQPNILDILRERHPPIGTSPTLRDKVNAVRVEGTAALDRLSHDIHLTILLR